MLTFNCLMDQCTEQDHWLSFDLNDLKGTYRIGRKTFRCMYKASAEVNRLVAQRAAWNEAERKAA